MSFNVNNNFNIPNYNIGKKDTEEVNSTSTVAQNTPDIKDAIKDFTNNDSNLDDMMKVLNALNAKNIQTSYEGQKLTLSFELNGKNYIIQARAEDNN